MALDFEVSSGVLSAAVATNGTFTVGWPGGARLGAFRSGKNHYLVVAGKRYSAPADFTVAYTNSTTITLTWLATNTLPAGASWRLQLDRGGDTQAPLVGLTNDYVTRATVARVNLGAPIVGAATGVTTAQLLGSAGNLTIDGTRATAGVATLDVARNVTLTVATTNQSGINFTVYGTDDYGAALVEVIAGPNNNTVQGKKAFKTVTRVAASAAIATNGVSVGFGNILGIPVFCERVLAEYQDGAAPTSGTIVNGLSVLTKSTGSTADVRGTYTPNATPDGAKVFELDIVTVDPAFKGNPQFTG